MGLYSFRKVVSGGVACIVAVLWTINVFKHVDAYSYNSVDVKLVTSLNSL
jgi:hypothetical protein